MFKTTTVICHEAKLVTQFDYFLHLRVCEQFGEHHDFIASFRRLAMTAVVTTIESTSARRNAPCCCKNDATLVCQRSILDTKLAVRSSLIAAYQ
jgi:hypothetical protein